MVFAKAAAVLVAVMAAAPASAFMAQNDLMVNAEGDATFEVAFRGLTGPADFWCAAGDYAVRRLNVPYTTRIYRVSPPPRRAGEGVRFSLRAADGAGDTGLVKFSGDPSSLSVAHATLFCDNDRPFDD